MVTSSSSFIMDRLSSSSLDSLEGPSLSTVFSAMRIPSSLLFCDSEPQLGPAASFYSEIGPNLTSQMSSGTRLIGTNRYKMMGLATPDEALRELDSATAVLFHGKMAGEEERPLLLAVVFNGMRFLLRVAMQSYPLNHDRFWGICGDQKKIFVAFRSKETLLQFYAMCPQAAIMSYFDV